MVKNTQINSDLPPIILQKDGREIKFNWPENSAPDKSGRYLAKLASLSTGCHRLLAMGWQRVEGIEANA